jgi:hypothetical protein
MQRFGSLTVSLRLAAISTDATMSAIWAYVLSTGFCQEVSKVIAQRSAAAISTNSGGPAFPTEWMSLYIEMQRIAHDRPSTHITQYKSVSIQLPKGLELCRKRVTEFEDKQKRLSSGFAADADIQQAVTARDMLRARAVQLLQQGLVNSTAIQHTHGGTSFLACADEFRALLPKLNALLEKHTRILISGAITTEQLRVACKEGCEAVAAWRTRHDTTVATTATNTALDALWAAVGASKGAVCNIAEDVLIAVEQALDAEYKILTETEPMSDFPTDDLVKVAAILAAYNHEAVEYLQKVQCDVDWATDALSKYQYAQSLQYPPSIELLQSLQTPLHSAERIIGHLHVDIAADIKRRRPVAELQTRLV